MSSFADILAAAVGASSSRKKALKDLSCSKYVKESMPIEGKLAHGRTIYFHMVQKYGPNFAREYCKKIAQKQKNTKPSRSDGGLNGAPLSEEEEEDAVNLPKFFWKNFIMNELHLSFSRRLLMKEKRCLIAFAVGATEAGTAELCEGTLPVMRGEHAPKAKRRHGGHRNAEKCRGLGFYLLQYFVDHVQQLKCRADAALLMTEARNRAIWLSSERISVPKLTGSAGKMWFKGWRHRYGISYQIADMKLKVPYQKIKKRVKCFLGNIWRLRTLWEECHPGVPMKFLSLDQKPAWFNNAGHKKTYAVKGGYKPFVRENYKQMKERYTILTSVPSWSHEAAGTEMPDPPKFAVLFKGSPDGEIIKNLEKSPTLTPYMKVQVQRNGSYRSADMVTALDWFLPTATRPEDSIVVILDWYSGHLTPEVAAAIRRKGHVLIFHGGGCTPFTQVNDTHLHGQLQAKLIEMENVWRCGEIHKNPHKTPKTDRETCLSIAKAAWLSIDHANVASKGYLGTGPTMPKEGPIKPEDVFPDLLQVMESLAPPEDSLVINTAMRDREVAGVLDAIKSGILSKNWAEAYKLIEMQDSVEEALQEGLEAFGVDPYDDLEGARPAREESASSEGEEANEEHDQEKDTDNELDEFDASMPGPDEASDAAQASKLPDLVAEADVAKAREVLLADAKKNRDDGMVKKLRAQMRKDEVKRYAAADEVAKKLRKRAEDERAEDQRRQRQRRDEEFQSAKAIEDAKLAAANQVRDNIERRNAHLDKVMQNRRDQVKTEKLEHFRFEHSKWLQMFFPVEVLEKCMDAWKKLGHEGQLKFGETLKAKSADHSFDRVVFLNHLWDNNKSFTKEYASTTTLVGQRRVSLRCSIPFQSVIEQSGMKTSQTDRDGAILLDNILKECFGPYYCKMFQGAYQIKRMLDLNDYILDKAFVYAILAASKLLSRRRFPQGYYGNWPPPFPDDKMPKWA